MTRMNRIGVLTSGGDCGGLNAVIRAIFLRANRKIQYRSFWNKKWNFRINK